MLEAHFNSTQTTSSLLLFLLRHSFILPPAVLYEIELKLLEIDSGSRDTERVSFLSDYIAQLKTCYFLSSTDTKFKFPFIKSEWKMLIDYFSAALAAHPLQVCFLLSFSAVGLLLSSPHLRTVFRQHGHSWDPCC
jgi:hypothetical protein